MTKDDKFLKELFGRYRMPQFDKSNVFKVGDCTMEFVIFLVTSISLYAKINLVKPRASEKFKFSNRCITFFDKSMV